jgi:hypothetical protein
MRLAVWLIVNLMRLVLGSVVLGALICLAWMVVE